MEPNKNVWNQFKKCGTAENSPDDVIKNHRDFLSMEGDYIVYIGRKNQKAIIKQFNTDSDWLLFGSENQQGVHNNFDVRINEKKLS